MAFTVTVWFFVTFIDLIDVLKEHVAYVLEGRVTY